MINEKQAIHKNLAHALGGPRITEKATFLSDKNVYTFNVPKDFNKIEIAQAVEAIYKVRPVQVRIIAVPAKNFIYRGKPGVKKGGKKALVYLKKGDKIEFV